MTVGGTVGTGTAGGRSTPAGEERNVRGGES